MTEYTWERIDGFQSKGEFLQFVKWIEKQVAEGACEEIIVLGNTLQNWQERHFKSKQTGEVWKLMQPDPGYYAGAWGPME